TPTRPGLPDVRMSTKRVRTIQAGTRHPQAAEFAPSNSGRHGRSPRGAISRPGDAITSLPPKIEGAGNAGCTPHPLPCVQNKENAREANTGTPKSSGTPCAMVLRLLRDLPREPAL